MRGGDPVGRASECQVASECQPGMITRAIIYKVAECLRFGRVLILHFPVYLFLHNGYRTSRAIVEKEIVSVNGVFRLYIRYQGIPYLMGFFGGEVEYLFGHFTSPHLIFYYIM